MGNEWITINKDVFDIGRYESLNEFKVFLYFVTHAAEHPTIYKGRALQRGQLALSITDACKRIGISKQSYRTVLRRFTSNTQNDTQSNTQSNTAINTEVTRLFTIITILNFDDYVTCEDVSQHGSNTQNNTQFNTQSNTENNKQPTSQPNPPKNPPFIQKEKENEKENLSPTPPIKEKDKEKEKASPQPSLRKKEKDKLLVCGKTKESGISFSSVAGATSDEQKDLRKEIERKKKLMEGRRVKFYNSLVPFVQMYGKAMVRDFFDYWSEPNKSETQMRYELERTWSLNLRLAYWSRNKKNYVRKSATDEKREANAAVIERLREDALRRLRPMDEEEPLPI